MVIPPSRLRNWATQAQDRLPIPCRGLLSRCRPHCIPIQCKHVVPVPIPYRGLPSHRHMSSTRSSLKLGTSPHPLSGIAVTPTSRAMAQGRFCTRTTPHPLSRIAVTLSGVPADQDRIGMQMSPSPVEDCSHTDERSALMRDTAPCTPHPLSRIAVTPASLAARFGQFSLYLPIPRRGLRSYCRPNKQHVERFYFHSPSPVEDHGHAAILAYGNWWDERV